MGTVVEKHNNVRHFVYFWLQFIFFFLFCVSLSFFSLSVYRGNLHMYCSACHNPAQWHAIVLLLSTWYNVAACIVVLWRRSLYLSKTRNRRGHWVCWISTSRKNRLM